MTQYLFYFLSFIAIFCALKVVISKNPVHSVLYLILTFFAIGCHYLILNAQFLAAVHIIVYAGAIMVLFLYVIMMLNLNKETEPHKSTLLKLAATITGGLLLVILVSALKGSEKILITSSPDNQIGLIKNLGQVLFKEYLLPFEVSSILFLSAMVGAVMLGKNEIK
ncbi:MAG: NADH-quinone oxidoreductase subunit J [Bacteroidetes bacterium]|nr:NADH-quinone oxidoreductase subunit J [Bacteroidota bacterium]MBK9673062.1 NADH-quinone oxidoreductase subunit J [Bacteroidota bacterium]MBK9799524.1 NADH-quinone oxidoreductase subunit J [Bacteroidota bacterium]MBP6413030.1 NADH-quinone oxidoreductase subunit J [Bacteroidia bacterium]